MTPRATIKVEPHKTPPHRCGQCTLEDVASNDFMDRPSFAFCGPHTPPPLQQNALRVALRENSVAKLEDVLTSDSNLVHMPLWTSAGCEPPCVAAVRMGCSVRVLDKLLQHG